MKNTYKTFYTILILSSIWLFIKSHIKDFNVRLSIVLYLFDKNMMRIKEHKQNIKIFQNIQAFVNFITSLFVCRKKSINLTQCLLWCHICFVYYWFCFSIHVWAYIVLIPHNFTWHLKYFKSIYTDDFTSCERNISNFVV